MPLLQRIAIFLGLWLFAGVTLAIFAKGTVDCGESEMVARLRLICFAPVVAAAGIVYAVVADHDPTWLKMGVWCIAMAGFVVHAVVTLTRRDRRQFMELVAVQVILLVGSVSCAIGLFRHIAEAVP